MTQLRSIKIHGGKFYLAKYIISHFPEDYQQMRYYEIFAGAANVLLNKEPSKEETYNDLDKNLAFLFYCLKNHGEYVQKEAEKVPYSLESFEWALSQPKKENTFVSDPKEAIVELVLRRMSRGGLKSHFSWSKRLRGGKPGDLNAFETFCKQIPLIQQRLQNVDISCYNGLELIQEKDATDVLFYLDPPYCPSVRTAKKVYDFELSEKDHIKLADVLKSVKGKVILSGYYSSTYSKLYSGWNLQVKEMPNHSSQSKKKQRRLECLWTNY